MWNDLRFACVCHVSVRLHVRLPASVRFGVCVCVCLWGVCVCVCVCVLAYESSGNAKKRRSAVDCHEDLG